MLLNVPPLCRENAPAFRRGPLGASRGPAPVQAGPHLSAPSRPPSPSLRRLAPARLMRPHSPDPLPYPRSRRPGPAPAAEGGSARTRRRPRPWPRSSTEGARCGHVLPRASAAPPALRGSHGGGDWPRTATRPPTGVRLHTSPPPWGCRRPRLRRQSPGTLAARSLCSRWKASLTWT